MVVHEIIQDGASVCGKPSVLRLYIAVICVLSASLTQHSAARLVYDRQTFLDIKYHMEDRLNVELSQPGVNHHPSSLLCPTHLCRL